MATRTRCPCRPARERVEGRAEKGDLEFYLAWFFWDVRRRGGERILLIIFGGFDFRQAAWRVERL